MTKPFIPTSGVGNVPFTMAFKYSISYVFNPLRSNNFANGLSEMNVSGFLDSWSVGASLLQDIDVSMIDRVDKEYLDAFDQLEKINGNVVWLPQRVDKLLGEKLNASNDSFHSSRSQKSVYWARQGGLRSVSTNESSNLKVNQGMTVTDSLFYVAEAEWIIRKLHIDHTVESQAIFD